MFKREFWRKKKNFKTLAFPLQNKAVKIYHLFWAMVPRADR